MHTLETSVCRKGPGSSSSELQASQPRLPCLAIWTGCAYARHSSQPIKKHHAVLEKKTVLVEGALMMQELFPESYAETAAWLRREVTANGDSLAQYEQQLQQVVEQDPHFQSLAAGCQVCQAYLL